MQRHRPRHSFTLATLALIGLGASSPAWTQDASSWEGDVHGAARLIAGAKIAAANNELDRAGVEIKLDPGWKTYWRYPGDSGVPPTFDFSGSQNVKSVTPLWPAPQRFDDGSGGYSIGYHDDVVLPLHIVPRDAGQPLLLHLKLGYAVCGKLCIPAQADLRLTLPGSGGGEEPALSAAESRVPRHVALGEGNGLAITAVHRQSDGTHERVIVQVTAPRDAHIDLFAEGPTPEWGLPLPQAVDAAPATAPGSRQFAFDIDGLPSGAQAKGALLTLTAVSPSDAIEVQARLD